MKQNRVLYSRIDFCERFGFIPENEDLVSSELYQNCLTYYGNCIKFSGRDRSFYVNINGMTSEIIFITKSLKMLLFSTDLWRIIQNSICSRNNSIYCYISVVALFDAAGLPMAS